MVPNLMYRWDGLYAGEHPELPLFLGGITNHLSQSEIGQLMSRDEERLIIVPPSLHLVAAA